MKPSFLRSCAVSLCSSPFCARAVRQVAWTGARSEHPARWEAGGSTCTDWPACSRHQLILQPFPSQQKRNWELRTNSFFCCWFFPPLFSPTPEAFENPCKCLPFLCWPFLTQHACNLEETDGPTQWLDKPRFFKKWIKNQKKQKCSFFFFAFFFFVHTYLRQMERKNQKVIWH